MPAPLYTLLHHPLSQQRRCVIRQLAQGSTLCITYHPTRLTKQFTLDRQNLKSFGQSFVSLVRLNLIATRDDLLGAAQTYTLTERGQAIAALLTTPALLMETR